MNLKTFIVIRINDYPICPRRAPCELEVVMDAIIKENRGIFLDYVNARIEGGVLRVI